MNGNISSEGLGLSAADTETLIEETSIIFHIAANVKFENTLKDSVLENVRATRDICLLGERMKNLAVSNHEHFEIRECAYKKTDRYMCC